MTSGGGKPGLTATMWVLLVVFGLLVIVGVVLWMMTKGQPSYRPSWLRGPRNPSVSLSERKGLVVPGIGLLSPRC